MAALRTRFVARAAKDRAAILEADRAGNIAEIRRISHALAGTAGTLGFPELGAAALRVEDAEDVRPMLGDLLDLLDQPR